MPPNKSANKTKPLQKSAETEKMNPKHIPASKIPGTSTVKKETENLAKYAEPISTVRSQKVETEPLLVTVTRRLPEEEYDYNPFLLKKESAIGYFPSPKPDDRDRERSDKALEALYRQQTMMMGALQAPKIELMEFHGDPMLYHAFIRSFEENVEKMLPDDGAHLTRLIHLCKGKAGRPSDVAI